MAGGRVEGGGGKAVYRLILERTYLFDTYRITSFPDVQ